MQIPSRFTIAVHILTLIAQNKGNETKLTSDLMAGSVGVNPVIIRKTLSQLKKAELISVQRGTGGASLLKDPEEINLLQVYRAVDSIGPSGQLFSFHDNPNPACPVGRNIHGILDQSLEDVQMAMEKELEKKTLAGILKDAKAIWKEVGA
ncbi:Rrf2 family transcriptional regulator [Streptococcus salivarius]|uniref:Rrf2 family transcriptional regulator n=1 Tax=Streptococcus salivarius TaxID=1304 RepID=UPI00191ABAB7|nr:Rrf2 family transcriptional regulator [Streptococcus salivarius]